MFLEHSQQAPLNVFTQKKKSLKLEIGDALQAQTVGFAVTYFWNQESHSTKISNKNWRIRLVHTSCYLILQFILVFVLFWEPEKAVYRGYF